MQRDGWLRVGLWALAVVPVPVFWVLGERSLDALEAADLRLRGERAEAALLRAVRDEARAAAAGPAHPPGALPLDDPSVTGVRDEPDGAFLAHPALLAARARVGDGALIDALEALDPLLGGSAGPAAEAAARLLAAEWLEAAGDVARGRAMRATAAPLADEVDRPAVARWIALASADGDAAAFEAWFDEVFTRATDLEELVLLRRLTDGRPDAAARRARLDARARWPGRVALLRERAAALDAQGLAVLAAPDGWWVVDGATAWRRPSLPAAVEALRVDGAAARWVEAGARSTARRRVVSGVVAEDGLVVDLGGRAVALELAPPRLFGTTSPRGLLAAGVAAWGGLALLLVFAVARHQRRSRELVAAREDLIAQVAHELRTPLTVLRMYGESLVEGRVPATRRAEYLRTMASEAARLGGLVDRVVRAARDEDPDPDAAQATCDAAVVVRRVAGPYRSAAEDAGGRLDLEPLPAAAPARIDEDDLRLLLDVVLENALRHGGVPPRIHVGMEAEDGVVRCLVEDEGPGLAAEDAADVERLFERWTRGRGARRGGAGMGLFLARRAARARGGDVTLEAGANGGVRAVVRLRAADGADGDERGEEGAA